MKIACAWCAFGELPLTVVWETRRARRLRCERAGRLPMETAALTALLEAIALCVRVFYFFPFIFVLRGPCSSFR